MSKMNYLDTMQIIMVTLKLLNKIDLSWGMVFLPIYIEIIFAIIHDYINKD